MSDTSERIETIQLVDALSRAIEILAPQLGTNKEDLMNFKIDSKRFTRLDKPEMLSYLYFDDQDKEGNHKTWYSQKVNDYLDLKMSEEGHERAKLIVDALRAIGKPAEPKKKKEDTRGWIGRNLTARNQKPDDD